MASDPAVRLSPDHRAGDRIAGRYELKRKLGEGGMGVVWVAHSGPLDVDVALKMLKRELAGTEAVQRMEREARTAAQLGHPALVRVLDFGTSEQGEPFLAMELLEGEELHRKLEREQRLPAVAAVALLLPIIDGLGTAHGKGIVHRDIKPENIFIATDGQHRVQPKVLDFGIAKLAGDEPPTRLTQVGAVMGSPFYLSPEQAEGMDDIDYRSDIWSVGVVLYELLTGTPPFAASNYNAQIRSILTDEPKPITELGVGDSQLWKIIARCLQKDREQRWASIWELGEALALWLFEQGVRVDAAARSLRHGWLDGTITGIKILVESQAPTEDAPPPSGAGAPSAQTLRQQQLARTHLRPRRRRTAARFAPLLFMLVAAAALGAAFGYRRAAPRHLPLEAARAEVHRAATVSAEVFLPAASAPVVEASPVPAEAVSAQAAPVEDAPAPSASQAVPAQSSSPSAPTAAPGAGLKVKRSRTSRSSQPAAPTVTSPRHNTEFGF